MFDRGSATSKALLMVVVMMAAAMLWALWPEGESFEEATGLTGWGYWEGIKQSVGLQVERAQEGALDTVEKAQIEAWLVQENLNRYGDPKDTAYTGGSPLFDEITGEATGRYDYIMEQHLDKPWQFTDIGKVKGVYDINLLPFTGVTSRQQFAYRSIRESLSDECADIYLYYTGEPGQAIEQFELCGDVISTFDIVDNWLIMRSRCNREYKRHILTGSEMLDGGGICPGSFVKK